MERRSIFDAVRKILDRGFTQAEVSALDAAIDAAMRETGEQLAVEAGKPGGGLVTSERGVSLIKRFEGCNLDAYPDPGTGGDPWTIGWGATRINGKAVKPGMSITQAQADALLLGDIERHANDVRKFLGNAATTQGQFDALVSFHFNTGALGKASLLRLHRGGDYAGAAKEFPRWKHAGGRVMKGLVRRRAAEQELYLS